MLSSKICLTANQLIRLISKREVSAREVATFFLDRIEKWDKKIRAWVFLDREKALKQASIVDEKISRGEFPGRLCGIPVGIKDIFNTVDMPTQMGSPLWEGFTPGNDARVVANIRLAGGIIPGKTVTAEFAVHYQDKTANPHNYQYSPGTSSSGSAAAVAASMVPLALGTQTAGSTIRPASYCGIYGFKPSFGLIPRTGMLKTADTLDTVSICSRSVQDLELLFDIARVHGPDYPVSYEMLDDPGRQRPLDGIWKVALVRGPKWGYVEDYARAAINGFASRIAKYDGIRVEEVELDKDFELAHNIHQVIYDKTLAYYFQEEFKHRALVSEIMYEIISRGNNLKLADYLQALEDQVRLSNKLDGFFEKYDLLLTLATPGEAPKGIASPDKPDSCLIWTLCGVPAVNLPVFKGPNHLPFGAQVVTRKYSDLLLLNFLRELEEKNIIHEVDEIDLEL